MQRSGSLSQIVLVLYHVAIAACAKLLSGGTIIAFDQETEELKVIRNGSVLIDGDRIVSVSDIASPFDVPAGGRTVFKTMGSNTTLADYGSRYSALVAAPLFTPDDLYISQLAGIYEAMAAGVTTIVDHAHHTWTPDTSAAGLRASVDSGARMYWAYTFQNSSAEFGIPEQIAQWKELAASMTSNLTQLAIAYDDFTTNPTGADTLAVADLIRESKSLLTTHHVEGPWLLGNSPEDLHRVGVLNSSTPVVIAHAAFLDVRGAGLLRSTNQHISITAESEMHYGHLHPTSHLIMDQASLGVDTHMTFSTDILTQARLWLQSTRYRVYQNTIDRFQVPAQNPFSVNQAFLLATRNGGLAVGRKDLGVIALGAQADLVVWEGRSPGMLGWTDPVAAVILHASVGDITHVLIGGTFKKRDGRLVDARYYDEVQDRFLASARRIQKVLKDTPLPSQEGSFLTGTPYGYVMQLDAKRGEGTGYGPSFV
ncbi:5-methylthioadenosine/S-adenosylhomocysteine deaminase [Apiospora marii]|uniref:5-methylthioadenosine/S-adenosylhomocysteine deaminase n=1 Tax=Apiospora marii TaxID=335849 RepID=A0ABR1RE48_9PEZI